MQISGKELVVHAQDASDQLEQRNLHGANSSLIKAGVGVMKHMKDIMRLLDRYMAVENYYKSKEEVLVGKINDVLLQERRAKSEKSSAESELQLQRNDFRQHEANLRSARASYEEADQKRKGYNAGTVTSSVVAGLAGLATIFTLGAAAPLTVPLAVGAIGGAVAFDKAADKAKDDMTRSENRIRHTNSRISSTEAMISVLSNTISRLNREQREYEAERGRLQDKKGKIKKVIVFLMDAQVYGREYAIVVESCSQRTALVKKFVDKAEKKSYSLFDSNGTERMLSSFEEAWATFEEMNENGSSFIFEIEFDCSRCSCARSEFPQVSSGQLVCADCYSEL